MQQIEPIAWRVLEMAEHAEAGFLPLSGGVLDQSHTFMQALRFVRGDLKHWRQKNG